MSGTSSTKSDLSAEGYPEQRHAGKVGYGPNYQQGPTLMDKIHGLSEEIHGKLAHKPELVKEGHDRKTGELKRRQRLGLDDEEPVFGTGQPEDKPKTPSSSSHASSSKASHDQPSSHSMTGSEITSPTGSMSSTSGPGAREQAVTIAPEGLPSATSGEAERMKDREEPIR